MQRLGDDLLAHERSVRICGVDEVDALRDGGPDDGQRALAVVGLPPYAGSRELHGAITQPSDDQIAAEGE